MGHSLAVMGHSQESQHLSRADHLHLGQRVTRHPWAVGPMAEPWACRHPLTGSFQCRCHWISPELLEGGGKQSFLVPAEIELPLLGTPRGGKPWLYFPTLMSARCIVAPSHVSLQPMCQSSYLPSKPLPAWTQALPTVPLSPTFNLFFPLFQPSIL